MMPKMLGWVFDIAMREPVVRFRRSLDRPFQAQAETLRRILSANAATEFGRKHGFAGLAALGDSDLWLRFRKSVPIRSYADFAPDVERMKNGGENILVPGRPDMFSLTSGSTGEPKFCPVNRAFIKEHHRQHLLWMYNLYRDHPAVNQGKYLFVASPAEMGRTAGGIPYGAMSGKQLDVQSIPVRRRMAAPALVQHLDDPEDRWRNFILFALAREDLRVASAVNPSTLLAIARRLEHDAPQYLSWLESGHPDAGNAKASPNAKRLAALFKPDPARARRLCDMLHANGVLPPSAVWPELEAILTWQGGSSAFYLPHVEALWGRTAKRCLGLRASEGTFSIPLRDNDPSGVLALGGHAMEFIPEEAGDPKPGAETLLAGELEEGKLYRLVATTSGGFTRYDMGDLVRVTGFLKNVPEVAFERRAGAVLSATGEKVTEDQAVLAVSAAAAAGPLLEGFTLTWEMNDGDVRYVLAIEPTGGADAVRNRRGVMMRRLEGLLRVVDSELCRLNIEYKAKREDGRLGNPRGLVLADGSYERLRADAAASGRPESQFKQPVLVPPPGPGRAPVKGSDFFDRVEVVAEV